MKLARTLRSGTAAGAAVLLLAACGSASGSDDAADAAGEEVTVTTTHGGETTVPLDPEKVVVFDYAALDTIDALGFGDRVVGIPSATPAPDYLAGYEESAENVGNLFEPDFEAINALEPDLIVAGGRSQAVVADLADIAPTIDVTMDWGSQPFLDSLQTNTVALGQVFGVEDEATAALDQLNQRAGEVSAAAQDDGTGLVVMTSGGELSAYGPSEEGRYDFVYNVLGVQPAADQVAIDTHGDAISFEFLAETDPEMMIVLDRDAAIGAEGESAAAILDNDLVNSTTAATDDQVVYADTAKWYLSFGGLSAMETIVDEVGSLVE
ncbi:ABC transporter substrate-binding protein [Nocardioides panacisoli]|uniref:siderophore ABC transporter substrate-binding protein n=1 Tax=Nocardioides panacisoli TaxID=627624 RepID=UPI001C627424|nr:ABC transporter substrate-binding protein [Nocardioides panacisoli]QYJ02797.1 ABC transporter substrate-binding protein [Nocardioides panacisoli]